MEDRNEVTRFDTEAKLQSLDLVLSITRYAWDKLMAYCQATDLEVSGFMVIEQDEMDLTVVDCFIAHQESTSASTEMDTSSIAKLQMELFRKGIIGKPNIRLGHFHTHPTFNVFWSGTDMAMRQVLRKGNDFYISLVLNQKGEALAAIDINGSFPMSISNLPIEIMPNTELFALCKAEVAEKVKSPACETAAQWWDRNNFAGTGRREPLALSGDTPPIKRKRGRPRKIRVGTDGITEVDRPDPDEQFGPDMSEEDKQALVGLIPDGGSYSDEHGTWANLGGEIVRIAGPDGEHFT